jgi:ER degradation enhancer, mannosidase alpha-like 2
MRKQLLLAASLLSVLYLNAQTFSEALKKEMRDKVVEATSHAWQGYRQFAWGYDDLQPLTKKGRNWYKTSLLMTPVDAFDTFIFLGMKKESDEAKQ